MTVEATTKAISVPRRTLSLLAISLVVLIAVGGLFKPSESTWIIVFGVFSLFFGSLIITTTGWMYVSLLLGFVLRVALLWVDLYTDIALFASGGDTENFYQTALSIYHDPSLFGADLYGGAFPKICAVLFWVVGPSRLFVQYLNILMSLVGMLFIGLSMHRLSIPEKTSRNVMLVCALIPVPAIISSIFLREALIFCLVAISFYAFTRWLAGGTIKDNFGCI